MQQKVYSAACACRTLGLEKKEFSYLTNFGILSPDATLYNQPAFSAEQIEGVIHEIKMGNCNTCHFLIETDCVREAVDKIRAIAETQEVHLITMIFMNQKMMQWRLGKEYLWLSLVASFSFHSKRRNLFLISRTA